MNGLDRPAPLSAGGRNNTKLNPVFRGMVRAGCAGMNLQPKENCD